MAADDLHNIEELSKAAVERHAVIGVLVEYDVGMGRCGVRSREDALLLAKAVRGKPGLEFRGIMGYEGHCMLEPNAEARTLKAREAMESLVGLADLLESEGIPVPVISAGGTGKRMIKKISDPAREAEVFVQFCSYSTVLPSL